MSRTKHGTSRLGRDGPVSNGFGMRSPGTYSYTISVPLACWLPALSITYRNLHFLLGGSRSPGNKTNVISTMVNEAEFVQSLIKAGKKRYAQQFNFTYRYIDDVLSLNNS